MSTNQAAATPENLSEFEHSILIEAPRKKVWSVLADIGSIHEWNPGLEKSNQTSKGVVKKGSTRRCNLPGNHYLDEEVVFWQPGQALTMRIIGTDLPFKKADIRFTLTDHEKGTRVTVSPLYQLKFGALGRLMDKLIVRKQYQKGMENMLEGLKDKLQSV